MDKQGLVAPVWSDSGDVPVGEVTCIRLDFDPLMTAEEWAAGAVAGSTATVTADGMTWEQEAAIEWATPTSIRLIQESEHVYRPSDLNAKPAIPALTRVGGNKRGPGWCDE